MGKIKTSITLDEKIWNQFCVAIVKEKGNRKISTVMEELIKNYLKNKPPI